MAYAMALLLAMTGIYAFRDAITGKESFDPRRTPLVSDERKTR